MPLCYNFLKLKCWIFLNFKCQKFNCMRIIHLLATRKLVYFVWETDKKYLMHFLNFEKIYFMPSWQALMLWKKTCSSTIILFSKATSFSIKVFRNLDKLSIYFLDRSYRFFYPSWADLMVLWRLLRMGMHVRTISSFRLMNFL